jgi:hypothetical protein
VAGWCGEADFEQLAAGGGVELDAFAGVWPDAGRALLEVVPVPDRGVGPVALAEQLEADIVGDLVAALRGDNDLPVDISAPGVRHDEFPQ